MEWHDSPATHRQWSYAAGPSTVAKVSSTSIRAVCGGELVGGGEGLGRLVWRDGGDGWLVGGGVGGVSVAPWGRWVD